MRKGLFLAIIMALGLAWGVALAGPLQTVIESYACAGGRIFVTPEPGGDSADCVAFTPTPTPTHTPTHTATPDGSVVLPIIWYKADVGFGGNQWLDQSGNNNHAGPGKDTSYRFPIQVQNELNGLPVIRFDGENDVVEFNNTLSRGDVGTVIIVARMRDTTFSNQEPNFYRLHGTVCNNGLERESWTAQENLDLWTFQYHACDGSVNIEQTWITASWTTNWVYIVHRFDVTSNVTSVRIGGVDVGSATLTDSWFGVPDEALIGAKTEGGAHACPCDYAEYRLYDSYLSLEQVQAAEAEIKAKWGL